MRELRPRKGWVLALGVTDLNQEHCSGWGWGCPVAPGPSPPPPVLLLTLCWPPPKSPEGPPGSPQPWAGRVRGLLEVEHPPQARTGQWPPVDTGTLGMGRRMILTQVFPEEPGQHRISVRNEICFLLFLVLLGRNSQGQPWAPQREGRWRGQHRACRAGPRAKGGCRGRAGPALKAPGADPRPPHCCCHTGLESGTCWHVPQFLPQLPCHLSRPHSWIPARCTDATPHVPVYPPYNLQDQASPAPPPTPSAARGLGRGCATKRHSGLCPPTRQSPSLCPPAPRFPPEASC